MAQSMASVWESIDWKQERAVLNLSEKQSRINTSVSVPYRHFRPSDWQKAGRKHLIIAIGSKSQSRNCKRAEVREGVVL